LFGCFTTALSGCGGNIVSGAEQGTLVASPGTVDFGSVSVGETASNTVSLVNGKSTPVEISQVNLTGQSFSVAAPADLPVTLAAGQSYNLNVQFNPAGTGDAAGQLTFTSSSSSSTSDKAMVRLTGTGTARGTSAAVLSALSCSNSAVTGAATDACTVTLSSAAPSGGLSVSLSSGNAVITVPTSVTVPYGATSATFTATISAITWSETVSLSAKAGSITKSFRINLLPAVTETTPQMTVPQMTVVSSGSPSTYGSAVALTATISSGPTGAVTFYDASTAIGTGTINGTTATFKTSSLTAGSHTITANWPGNSSYSAVTSSAITQVVNKVTPTITWPTPAAIAYGTALSATQLDASSSVAGSFSYSPAAGTVLTAGSHTITATFTPTDTSDYTIATATVSINVNTGAPTITWPTPAAIAYGTALSATQLDATSSVAGTFSYSPVAGTVLTAGSHTITATFTPTDTSDYTSATATVSITVNTGAPAITWPTPAAIAYGTALSATQLDASSSVAGSFSYSPVAGTVLTAGSHTITATFTPTDTSEYTTAAATVSVSVTAGAPTITWPTPSAIAYGTALSATQLDASSSVAGSFTYSPAAGTVLTAGSHTITATFTPTDTTDYKTATATISITVTAVTPSITWATPSAITYGTALSSTQLDASSTVAGTFVYSPAAGTVLTAGSQTLSVTFTPTDTADYTTATQTVTLTVTQGTSTLGISATSLAFGDVTLNTTSTQSVTLTSTGTGPVTVSAATLTETGFTMSGITFPVTLTSGQTETLNVQFDPTATGAATGQLTITSNSSTNSSAVITLSGTGTAASYAVNLSWDAPTSSADPVAGYNVYRARSGSSTYALLNSSPETVTSYVDSTVVSGQTYNYIAESVDAAGVESVPSNVFSVTIP
jgi:hypothetical protein